MMIIGLAGTLNAGKDSLGNLLTKEYGMLHISTSDMIRQMKRREFGDTPQALLLRNDPYINKLRAERGPGFLIDAVREEWETKKGDYPGGVIASGIRAIGEAERIHELGGVVIFVDADPRIRYERSQSRLRDENESGMSFDDFMATELSEIDVDPNDKNTQNLGAMKKMADVIIENNHSDLHSFVEAAIAKLDKVLNAGKHI